MVSKTRVIYSDVMLLAAMIATWFLTEHFTKNVLAMCLVVAILAARSTFWHINWYKRSGKIY